MLWCAPARAQAEDQPGARALFNEGRAQMTAGRFVEACLKFEAASKLYASSGVLLNLADCYEQVGRAASAWSEFGEAASAADRQGRGDDEREAERRQAAIEPKLSRLTVQVGAGVPGLIVKRDGIELAPGAWGIAVPVDPGTHTLSAEAPGRTPWSASVAVVEAGKTVTVQVPELAPAAPAASTAPVASPPPAVRATSLAPAAESPRPMDAAPAAPYWTGRRTAGVVLVGAGVIGLGVGGLVGLLAKSEYTTAAGEHGSARSNDSASAVSTGNVASVVVVVGAAAAAGGLIVWLTAPSGAVQVGTAGGEVLVRGRF